jgi:uncharacterized protein (TIGR00255 family)
MRSTNHRYLEIECRLSNGLNGLQARISERIREAMKRGRIEVSVNVQGGLHERRRVVLDDTLLQRYHAALVDLKGRFGIKGAVTLEHLLALPQAWSVIEERVPPEKMWEAIRRALDAALDDLARSRRREGAKLETDVRRQLQAIERNARAIKSRLPQALAHQRRRLREQLVALLGSKASGSAAVLGQAVALVKDADVHEELVRLESHLAYMRQTLSAGPIVGKRLDFIAQELMRETNTTGAKVDDPQATQHVVEIKGCIEKIREQVQNLE